MVNAAKLTLIISGLLLAFVFRVKSLWLFALSLIGILLIGFLALTAHQGGALEFSIATFFLTILALFRYLLEIKRNEK